MDYYTTEARNVDKTKIFGGVSQCESRSSVPIPVMHVPRHLSQFGYQTGGTPANLQIPTLIGRAQTNGPSRGNRIYQRHRAQAKRPDNNDEPRDDKNEGFDYTALPPNNWEPHCDFMNHKFMSSNHGITSSSLHVLPFVMAVTFFAVDPQKVDGSELSLAPEPSSSSSPSSFIIIWRLIVCQDTTTPEGLYLPLDSTLLVDALSTLFPQLSTNYIAGPDLATLTSCLARTDTFTLFLATETTSRLLLDTPSSSSSDTVVPKISLKIESIVGCLTLITLKLLMNSRAHIEDLVVSNACRGKGVGRGLMKRALKDAAGTHGCMMVDLTSKPDRVQARALYESLGFQIRDTGAFRYYAPATTTTTTTTTTQS
ncbi:hypothetical protein BGZ54_006366 [Gamsiella multidivaricata]|nr:hypothetical protein BGZ54_006366 [Gamsiella multidivaricata]